MLRKYAVSIFVFVAVIALVIALSSITSRVIGSRNSQNPALQFEYQTQSATQVKVFYDLGFGLNEKGSSLKNVVKTDEWIKIRLELPRRVIHKLRLDPAGNGEVNEGTFRFRNMRIVDAFQETQLIVLPGDVQSEHQILSRAERNGELKIETIRGANDPQLKINLGNPIDLSLTLGDRIWKLLTLLLEGWAPLWSLIVGDLFFVPRVLKRKSIVLSLVTHRSFAPALLVVPLFFVLIYLIGHPSRTQEIMQQLDDKCPIGDKACLLLLAPFGPLVDAGYSIRRNSIPKNELPMLRLYMSSGALRKLNQKRNITLAKQHAILLANDNDWVDAVIFADNGSKPGRVTASLRLKGDWASSHLNYSPKLSLRIKVKKQKKVFGMSKFSIQAARTRAYENEALVLAMMRRVGVLAPRYFFVDVWINDHSIGIMALEEHFSKELVESQQRRDGPIVAIDEDWFWQQTALSPTGTHASNLSLQDYPVKVFRPKNLEAGLPNLYQQMRGVALLRDYLTGRISHSRVFDLDLMSRWWIMTEVWGGYHGMTWNNQRYFYNVVTERLEPVSFDNDVEPTKRWGIVSGFGLVSLLNNNRFRDLTRTNLETIKEMLYSEDFFNWFQDKQGAFRTILYRIDEDTGRETLPVTVNELRANLEVFSVQVESLFNEAYSEDGPITQSQKVMLQINDTTQTPGILGVETWSNDPIHNREFMESGNLLYTHIRPFLFASKNESVIEIKNVTLEPVTVLSVYLKSQPQKNLLHREIRIPSYQKSNKAHVYTSPVDLTEFHLGDEMKITYWYRGQKITKPVIRQSRNYQIQYKSIVDTPSVLNNGDIQIDEGSQTITFPNGTYKLAISAETPMDWQVIFLPGALLEFEKGAVLRVNGPVHALGKPENPVTIKIASEPSPGGGPLGSWGGLLVVNAKVRSILRNLKVYGIGESDNFTRQDSNGLTGCITFYGGDLSINNSQFTDLQCEDALNLIGTNFDIEHLYVTNSKGDAVDLDFSTGSINMSVFQNIGNDAIDVSGGNIEIRSTQFVGVGDKAISVGERSTVIGKQLEVSYSTIGIASKDSSLTNIESSNFDNIGGSTLLAYVKKEEYGPSELNCSNCNFSKVGSVAVEQYGSQITVNGNDVDSTTSFGAIISRYGLYTVD